jgi:hypothetical protein
MSSTVRNYYRFAVSLKRRARAMKTGRHDETHALAMQLAAAHIAFLAQQWAIALRAGEIALAQLQAERARNRRDAA